MGMRVWQSKDRLFATDAVHWSKSAKVLHQYAIVLQERGDLHSALWHYVKSEQIFDDQAITDYCIARILLHLDRVPEALAYFDKTLNGHGEQLDQGIYYMKEGLNRSPHNCYGWNAL